MNPRFLALLFPPPPDEGFRQELLQDVQFATLVTGGLELLLALILPVPTAIAGAILGLTTLFAARTDRLYEHLRPVVLASGWCWLAIVAWFVPANLAILSEAVIVVSLFALLPQTLWQGCLCAAVPAIIGRDQWPLPAVAIAGAMLAPFQYRYRWDRYHAHLNLVQSAQELRAQQERALIAEHAATLERLAAAMSHELNTPTGAIRSSVQTLDAIMEKYRGASEERRENLAALHRDVCECLLTSSERVHMIVARLQRLTSLDRADVRLTDFNFVLQDVAAAVEAGRAREVAIRLNLHPVPTILCEAQSWTTILMRLVADAAAHPHLSELDISSRLVDGYINIDIPSGREVNGTGGMDPGFTEDGGRIGTSNWSLFQIRGWTRQLGGELRFVSAAGRTVTRLTIPVRSR